MLVTALVFLFILSVLILIHEIGHFTAAKKLGIKVEEFGFGLPPRMFGIKRGETIYSINWLPIGGFVKLYGEEGEERPTENGAKITKDKNRAFYARPAWQRSIVLLSGVFMNFVLAVVGFSYLLTQGVYVPVDRVHIEKVEKNSPAESAGLKQNDIIKSINDIKITNTKEFVELVDENLGKEISLTVLRGSALKHTGRQIDECRKCEQIVVTLVPRENPPTRVLPMEKPGFISRTITKIKDVLHIRTKEKPSPAPQKEGPVGVVISSFEIRVYPWYEAPVYGIYEGLVLTGQLAKGIGITLWKLVTFQAVSKDIAGPIGIAQITGRAVRYGSMAILELLSLLSLNLAIVNILPFPALDGGRLLFVVIEAVTGKKIHTNWERYVHQIGMVILLSLMILITINDLLRVFGG